jgi:putative ABC transport system permease protein
VLGLFVGEAVTLALVGGLLGALGAYLLIQLAMHGGQAGFFTLAPVSAGTVLVAMMVAAAVGFLSAVIPSYRASQINIVEGLRHIG